MRDGAPGSAGSLSLGLAGRDRAAAAHGRRGRSRTLDASDHEEQLAHDLALHPLVESRDELTLEQAELLEPGGRTHRHDQARAIQAHRLGIAGNGLADYLVPRLPDAIVVEPAIQTDS